MTAIAFNVRGVAVPYTRVVPGRNGKAHRDAKTRHWEALVEDAVALARELEDFTHRHPPVLPEDPAAAPFDEMSSTQIVWARTLKRQNVPIEK